MLAHFKKKIMAPSSTAVSPLSSYRWCYVEQVDQAAPLANRSNGWRYFGPRGVTYRRQAVFGTGFRVRTSFPSSTGPGHKWFNSHPLGGDPRLDDFQTWAKKVLQRGMVHPRDAEAWREAFVDVEGGGQGQLVVSAADETWRTILCWASAGRRIEVDTEGIPVSLANLQVEKGISCPQFSDWSIFLAGNFDWWKILGRQMS